MLSGSLLTMTMAIGLASAVSPTNVNGAKYNKPNAGPPGEWFSGSASLPASKIAAAAAKANKVPKDATYILSNDNPAKATIHSDWTKFSKGAAYVFVADMDVDCDGIDYKCKGNGDGEQQTDFGALAAYEVPWAVIPHKFQSEHTSELAGNNVVAVICDGKIFYGVFGDTDGDTPETIGEASWLMANTCFPGQGLDGANGHTPADVTYIFFTGDESVLPQSAIGENYLTNFNALQTLGDQLLGELVANLNL